MKMLLAACLILLAGCTSKTEFGNCVGAFDEKDPKKIYKLDIGNLVIGAVFFELIAPPIYVIADQTHCPVGNK